MENPPQSPATSWQNGNCIDAYKKMGAHCYPEETVFSVWAPNARGVYVTGDFNEWDRQANPLTFDTSTGIWESAVAEAKAGDCYKFSIILHDGSEVLKADPFGFYHEHEAPHASVIYPFPDFSWNDDEWLSQRAPVHQPDKPLSIYEVHVGSWRRKASGSVLSYVELADELVPYVKKMGFTHIELMPIMEHPYTPSWGYQVTGYYAPTARYGTPEEFMVFVDACHRNGIGVILDWVPGHFPKDEHGLSNFDGTSLYEHEDHRRREHADWGTHNFDFEKPAVRNFLLSNAFFWCEKYHIDGFRVDAVASMLYLNYSKKEGEWLPNTYGGKENLAAVALLQDLNDRLGEYYPSVLTIAEESTSWPGVTKKTAEGGLGFDYKWNMGWMKDTLHYFEQPPVKRIEKNHPVTFPITFAFNEQFILPISHDEVVHLKKSLWSKMPGTSKQKFAQLKLFFLYMIGYPGKKHLFMGSEWAVKQEWSESVALDWELLNEKDHKGVQQFVSELLHFYQSEPALHDGEYPKESFNWVDIAEKEAGVFSFIRTDQSKSSELLFIFNFTSTAITNYEIERLNKNTYELVFNSLEKHGNAATIKEITPHISLKPFQGLVLRPKEKDN